jgi:hypothetical protein
MASKDIESGAAIPFIRDLAAAIGKLSAGRHANGIEADPMQLNEPAQEIELPLQIDPGHGIGRIGIEALEGLLAEIGADNAVTLRLSLGDETPVRIGLALVTPDADRQQALASALELAADLIKTERRA